MSMTLEQAADLLAAYDDERLTALCRSHFPRAYARFSAGMPTERKRETLLEHCARVPGEDTRLFALLQPDPGLESLAFTTPLAGLPKDPFLPDERAVRPAGGETGEETAPGQIVRRYALLIGVRDYVDPAIRNLPHTVWDVMSLEAALSERGYLVRSLHSAQSEPGLQPTAANIWGELANLAGSTGPGDLLLVHFGGHGYLEDQKVFLMPADARLAVAKRTAIALEEFKNALAEAGAQARILLLDACHSGFGRDVQPMSREFQERLLLEAEGLGVLAACRQGQVAYEHDQQPNGAFTYFVLDGLKGGAGGAALRPGSPYITFQSLSDYVTLQVKNWAIDRSRQQWPNVVARLTGDPALAALDAAVLPTPVPACPRPDCPLRPPAAETLLAEETLIPKTPLPPGDDTSSDPPPLLGSSLVKGF